MIRFRLDEMMDLIPAFHNSLARAKRKSPPGKWRPYLKLNYTTEQDEDSDQWMAWLHWRLMEGAGTFPCRDTGKNEWISRMDPPDRFKTLLMAEAFAEDCQAQFRAQYNKWIQGDFGGGMVLP